MEKKVNTKKEKVDVDNTVILEEKKNVFNKMSESLQFSEDNKTKIIVAIGPSILTLVGIAMILHYEKKDIITSSSSSLINKIK